jgi:hypothetical protein
MTTKLNEPLESAVQRVGVTGAAISEMNLMWALELGDPRLTSVLRESGLSYQSAMDEYHGIRDSKVQVHRVQALTPPTEYVLRSITHGKK